MKFGPIPLAQARGKILGHNLAGPDGRRAFRKGRPLTHEDVARLRELGRTTVYVAELEPDDVGEDAAAGRIARALAHPDGVRFSGPASGRVNLLATALSLLRVDAALLERVNEHEGVTAATLPPHTAVRPRQLAATVKIIPFAVPQATVRAVEEIAAAAGPLIRLDRIPPRTVSLVLSGSPGVRERVAGDFEPPLRKRLEALGSSIGGVEFVPLEDEAGEAALAAILRREAAAGSGLIVLAGETAVMDRGDIAPRAIERAGGEVTCFGAPVDPGNLLLVGYLGAVPVLGAPGCARSRRPNVVDRVLPRLLAGDRLTRADIVALGAGGLLEDIPERPMPRLRRKPLAEVDI